MRYAHRWTLAALAIAGGVGLHACADKSPVSPSPTTTPSPVPIPAPSPTTSTATIHVSPSQHVILASHAGQRVVLSAGRNYMLTASGSASLGGHGVTTSKLFYYAYIASGQGNFDAYVGELPAGSPRSVGGSASVYFFFVDDAMPGNNDNSGSMQVQITG